MCDVCGIPLEHRRVAARRAAARGAQAADRAGADEEADQGPRSSPSYGPSILATPQDERLLARRLPRPDRGASSPRWSRSRSRFPRWRRRRPPARQRRRRRARRSAPPTRGASTRTSRASAPDRTHRCPRRRDPGRHDGHRRLRGRLRVVRLAVRAAARARLPLGRLRRQHRRHAHGRAQALGDPLAGGDLLPVVHDHVRRARHDGDVDRLDAARLQADARPRRRDRDRRDGRVLPARRRSCRG